MKGFYVKMSLIQPLCHILLWTWGLMKGIFSLKNSPNSRKLILLRDFFFRQEPYEGIFTYAWCPKKTFYLYLLFFGHEPYEPPWRDDLLRGYPYKGMNVFKVCIILENLNLTKECFSLKLKTCLIPENSMYLVVCSSGRNLMKVLFSLKFAWFPQTHCT